MDVSNVRNIAAAELELGPGLNVFVGRNAQGKTSLLEAVGLLARGRSFRTDETASLIRRGAGALRARGIVVDEDARETALEVEVHAKSRQLKLDGRDVGAAAYQGRLEVVVYATDRLKLVRGPMRERRQFIDRSAAALRPAYRHALREYERVLLQRNAALESGAGGGDAWDERFVVLGAALRHRRQAYVGRLRQTLANGLSTEAECYDVLLGTQPTGTEQQAREVLDAELAARARDERRARRSLVGPHRDTIALTVNGEDAAQVASSGQARSLLLALTLATLEVYREERGSPAVALLDDLDSELDEARALAACRAVAGRAQALVTTAHAQWARSLAGLGRLFQVEGGQVTALGES
jgi:DNA replication and repair protein RecF